MDSLVHHVHHHVRRRRDRAGQVCPTTRVWIKHGIHVGVAFVPHLRGLPRMEFGFHGASNAARYQAHVVCVQRVGWDGPQARHGPDQPPTCQGVCDPPPPRDLDFAVVDRVLRNTSTWKSCLGSALTKLVVGLTCMAAMATFGASFNLHKILHTTFPSVVHQWGAVYMALLITRCKYYFAWKVAEGSTVLSGFGFEGFSKDGHVKGWNGVSNVDILGFEMGQSIRDLSRAWNQGTQAWLQRYVYERMNNSLLATYFVSAIWHGFYPGYYLFFLSVPLPTAVNRLARSILRPYVVDNKTFKCLYDVVGTIATALTINYLAVAFVSLSWENSVHGWRTLLFLGHIILVAVYLSLTVVPRKKVAKAA
ncbi:hypothetical protein, variant 2 [Aphanomyces invadans]|uniref:Lysophospholipid acyltransferase n=1 Tax=Aphanomyces invadans TaxID=157072 RepID=A0A024TC85_9STRA|nr:hypothetical protein, variant 2 [Aphanomyces invadans]ETV90917.1 hypothetical protein, variant 2 [Aphanomyces invadans]|eukprot:XP_008880481.1 hypothetical protein, variant 2 [Aphanomyces invadans]